MSLHVDGVRIGSVFIAVPGGATTSEAWSDGTLWSDGTGWAGIAASGGFVQIAEAYLFDGVQFVQVWPDTSPPPVGSTFVAAGYVAEGYVA